MLSNATTIAKKSYCGCKGSMYLTKRWNKEEENDEDKEKKNVGCCSVAKKQNVVTYNFNIAAYWAASKASVQCNHSEPDIRASKFTKKNDEKNINKNIRKKIEEWNNVENKLTSKRSAGLQSKT